MLILAVASLTACDSRPESRDEMHSGPAPAAQRQHETLSAPVPPTGQPAAQAPEARAIVQLQGLTFEIPQGWVEVPPANTMRLAELQVPGDPPITITFTSAGGDIRANLDRWAAQFSGGPEARFSTREVRGITIHTAEAQGAYRNMGEPPQEGFALRGAVIPTQQGTLFIKMTGPSDDIERESAAFYNMLDSIR